MAFFGRKLRMLVMDDGYVVDNTVKVVKHMLDKEPVFALMNMTGTSNVAAVLPLLEKTNPPMPLMAPFTGADGADSAHQPRLQHPRQLRG